MSSSSSSTYATGAEDSWEESASPMSSAEEAFWGAVEYGSSVVNLPHAGGDPLFAADRAERSSGTKVRVLPAAERTKKPACTVNIGGERFEVTDPRTGRKPGGDRFLQARYSVEADLPTGGWIDVPADKVAIATHAEAVVTRHTKESEDFLAAVIDPSAATMPSIFAAAAGDSRRKAELDALRDDYASRAAAGTL